MIAVQTSFEYPAFMSQIFLNKRKELHNINVFWDVCLSVTSVTCFFFSYYEDMNFKYSKYRLTHMR